jgi:hypothetical protein
MAKNKKPSFLVEQRKPHDPGNGVTGDCYRACVASMLRFPYEAVPAFEDTPSSIHFRLMVDNYLAMFDLYSHRELEAPDGYSIAVGPSPRFPGMAHCCIALDGEIIHDPHPRKAGLETTHCFETFRKLSERRAFDDFTVQEAEREARDYDCVRTEIRIRTAHQN